MPGLAEGAFAEGEYLPRLNREDERFAEGGVRMEKHPVANPVAPSSVPLLRPCVGQPLELLAR